MNARDILVITSLILFYSVFIGRSVVQAIGGVNPFALGLKKKGFPKALEIFFFFALAGWTLAAVCQAVRIPVNFLPPVLWGGMLSIQFLWIAGGALIVFGLLIFIWAIISFKDSWRIGIDTKHPGQLVTNGAFSISRNPIFLFIDLYFIGIWLIYPNLLFGIFAVLIAAGVHFQILQEEKFLAAIYGEEYEKYRSRVKRYLGA